MHIEEENVLYLWDEPNDVKRENVFIEREREERALSSTPRERGIYIPRHLIREYVLRLLVCTLTLNLGIYFLFI